MPHRQITKKQNDSLRMLFFWPTQFSFSTHGCFKLAVYVFLYFFSPSLKRQSLKNTKTLCHTDSAGRHTSTHTAAAPASTRLDSIHRRGTIIQLKAGVINSNLYKSVLPSTLCVCVRACSIRCWFNKDDIIAKTLSLILI